MKHSFSPLKVRSFNGGTSKYSSERSNKSSDPSKLVTHTFRFTKEAHSLPTTPDMNTHRPLRNNSANSSTSHSSLQRPNTLSTQADKGMRAVQVLGIMFAVFVIFYLPFFATYTINGTCRVCADYISPQLITAFEWLAYSGSMVNPIIYHIFNREFRRAFSRLMRCRCRKN